MKQQHIEFVTKERQVNWDVKAIELYRMLFPRKLLNAIVNQLNCKMRDAQPQEEERKLKKKLYKMDQIQDYFAIKIIMGYIKMPQLDDYFDEQSPFQTKIGEFMKIGRFKCVEQWTSPTDQDLLKTKENTNKDCCYRICRKVNKISRKVLNAGYNLILTINRVSELNCVLLFDVASEGIVGFMLCNVITWDVLYDLLMPFKSRGHMVHFTDKLLSVPLIMELLQMGIYCTGELNKQDYQSANNNIRWINMDNRLFVCSECNAIREYNDNELISMHTTVITKIPQFSNHGLRCDQSYQVWQSAIMSEIHEICLWNAFQCYRDRNNITHCQFRIMVVKQSLETKIETAMANHITLPLPRKKVSVVGTNTDISGPFGNGNGKNASHSIFHIPTAVVPPASFTGQLFCLVCKKFTVSLTLCRACSEISGKLVTLCACECFFRYHQNTHDYICYGEDVQFERSNLVDQTSQQMYYETFQLDKQRTMIKQNENDQ